MIIQDHTISHQGTHTAFLNDFCQMRISVTTNGEQGGDAGHGGRTVVSLLGCGDITFRPTDEGRGLEIEALGDAELRVLMGAFEFALKALIQEAGPVHQLPTWFKP